MIQSQSYVVVFWLFAVFTLSLRAEILHPCNGEDYYCENLADNTYACRAKLSGMTVVEYGNPGAENVCEVKKRLRAKLCRDGRESGYWKVSCWTDPYERP